MKKTIDQLNLENKTVIIRVDFNVPMKGSKVASNTRIVAALPTIQKALKSNAKVILLSHLGRVKVEADKKTKTLKPIAKELSELLKRQVNFVPHTKGEEVTKAVKAMKPGDIIMLENTRFEDLNNKAESGNDPKLGKFWASLGDVFINDAFGTAHRSHASNVGIATHIKESAIGYLIEKELQMLSKAIDRPESPSVAIIGGAKVSDKIKTIEHLIRNVDKLIIGGGMAFTFLKSQGFSVGDSIVELDKLDLAASYLRKYGEKIILPIDAALSDKFENETPIYNTNNSLEIPDGLGLMGLDIGPKSMKLFSDELQGAKTVIWNGPLGVTEFSNFAKGTESIAIAIGNLTNAYTVVGGGDSVAAIKKIGLESKFSHISTGGGACLALLEGSKLPGIEVIQDIKDTSSNTKTTNVASKK